MKKGALIAIILGTTLLVGGAVIFAIGLATAPKEVATSNTYTIEDSFNSFDIDVGVSDVVFTKSEDGSSKIICDETDKIFHTVTAADNVLKISQRDDRVWYNRIFNFSFVNYKVTIAIPEGEYSSLTVKNSTGNVVVPHDFSFDSMNVSLSTGNANIKSNVTNDAVVKVSTGNINLSSLTAKNLNVESSTGNMLIQDVAVTGDINLKASTGHIHTNKLTGNNLVVKTSTGYVKLTDTVLTNNITIETDTGDVRFEDSDAETLKITTHTGDVTGTLLTSKIFYVETSTGHTNYPHSTEGGLCEIKTKTGDVNISIKGN